MNTDNVSTAEMLDNVFCRAFAFPNLEAGDAEKIDANIGHILADGCFFKVRYYEKWKGWVLLTAEI